MTRRQMLVGSAEALAAVVGGSFAAGWLGSGPDEREQMETLFSGEEEPECNERFETLPIGKRMAHLACDAW